VITAYGELFIDDCWKFIFCFCNGDPSVPKNSFLTIGLVSKIT